jgi:aspartate/glutamate racemase
MAASCDTKRERVQALILARAELPLLLIEPTASGIPLFDTTQIPGVSCEAAVGTDYGD